MGVNKVVYNTGNGPETLIDLTGDTVTPATLAAGATAHDASGAIITGTATPVTLVQGIGTRTDAVMSQKAVMDALNGLSLGIASDGLIYIFVNGTPVGTGVSQGASGDVFGYVDENNTIVLTGNLADGTYSVKYEMESGTTVNIGNMVLDSTVYYTVTSNLTNCTNSNSTKSIAEGSSYSATITANSGYELKSVTATMGGSAVTVTNGVINITNVTGNIVITAVAEEVQTSGYTNLANPNDAYWKEGYRLSISSGGTSALEGHTTTNFIPATAGSVLRVKGMKLTSSGGGTSNDCKIVLYSAKDNESSKVAGAYGSGSGDTYTSKVTVNGDVSSLTVLTLENGTQLATSTVKYLRIDGTLLSGYSKNDVIITINEPIE